MLKNCSRALETLLNNCEISLILTWRTDCVIPAATGAKIFEITTAKFYVSVVILSNQNNAKL